MVADRRQIASLLLGLISSLLACMQLNVALLNAEISYARSHLKALYVVYRTKRPAKTTRRAGKQCRPRRFWFRPARTSAWWDNLVNPQWIRSESEYDGQIRFEYAVIPERVDADIFVSRKKKLRIQKYPDTCGRGLKCTVTTYVIWSFTRIVSLASCTLSPNAPFCCKFPCNFGTQLECSVGKMKHLNRSFPCAR